MVIKAIVEWKNPFIRSVSHVVFFPLSLLFGIAAQFRNKLYDFRIFKSLRCNTFIIGVGSLSVGGSGKTPLVEFLAELLARRGLKIGVISNGYGKKSTGAVVVSDGKNQLTDVYIAGDEAYLMAVNFQKSNLHIPVISGSDRICAVRILQNKFNVDVIILDDAFQYRKIKKSIEFIAQDYFESAYPLMTLPSGRLREFKSNMQRADALIITKSPEGTDEKQLSNRWQREAYISHYFPAALQRWFDDVEFPLITLTQKKILLFSALGYNTSFQSGITELCSSYQAQIVRVIEFQDHHWYTEDDLRKMLRLIPEENSSDYIILTTQKDVVKLKPEWLPKKYREAAYFIKSEFSLDSQIQFENMIKISHIVRNNKTKSTLR
ncbi:tetraacyldisaccharide 4'-kinase [bacterium]|nr:MAG: tetraacyldisaccharide 4'-kinase [bacterium]